MATDRCRCPGSSFECRSLCWFVLECCRFGLTCPSTASATILVVPSGGNDASRPLRPGRRTPFLQKLTVVSLDHIFLLPHCILPAIPEPDVEPVEDFRILFRLDAAEGEIDGDGLLRSELQV